MSRHTVSCTPSGLRDRDLLAFAAVEGEALLIGIGTFAIGVAGFSAVAASLRQGAPAWTPAHSLRVRAIVSTSFNVAFESIVPLIAVSALGDPFAAVRLAGLLTGTYALAVVLLRLRQILVGGLYRTRSVQILMVLGPLSTVLFFVSALVPSIAVYALGLCVQLGVAAFSFYSLVATTT